MSRGQELYTAEKITPEEVYNKVQNFAIGDLREFGLTYLGILPNGFLLGTNKGDYINKDNLEIIIRDVSETDSPPIIITSDIPETITIGERRLSDLLQDNLIKVEPLAE